MRVHCLKVKMKDGRIVSVQLGKWFPVRESDKSVFSKLNEAERNNIVVDFNDDVMDYIIASCGLYGIGDYIISDMKNSKELVVFDYNGDKATVVPYEIMEGDIKWKN